MDDKIDSPYPADKYMADIVRWSMRQLRKRKDYRMPKTKQETDFSLLRDKNAAEHEGYDAFLTAMKGKVYGEEPLNDAWEWFKIGWADGYMLTSDT